MEPAPGAAGLEAVRAVADAILYEGYLLYPYRRSAAKNRTRWQFGVLLPRAWARAHGLTDAGVAGSAESWWQRTECLLRTSGQASGQACERAKVRLRVRFLQPQQRSVEERVAGGGYRPVDRIDVGSRLELTFDEAVPREYEAEVTVSDLLAGGRRLALEVPGGMDTEPVVDDAGRDVGRVRRRRWPVTAAVALSAAPAVVDGPAADRTLRLTVLVENITTPIDLRATRDEALRRSLVSCHTVVGLDGAWFVSSLDPPEWAQRAVRACSNVHTFPVLAGEPGRRDVILSSPILLYDHPRIAPESPADLHDATEIDEILSLRTLTLTDDEKREARATDPRAARIVDGVEAMSPEVLSGLHGAVRSRRPAADSAADSVADSAAEVPGVPEIVVSGRRVARGSRVRLRPRRQGTDPQDMFVDGRTARVEAVLLDVDDAHHLAVTLEDDPAAELNQWYGRFRYFSPDEVEPLAEAEEPR